jgi:hypothetical protein
MIINTTILAAIAFATLKTTGVVAPSLRSADVQREFSPREDTSLVPPFYAKEKPILATIVAYNWRDDQEWPDDQYELPIYSELDREKNSFWTYLVDELLLSRVPLVLPHSRGCLQSNNSSSLDGTTRAVSVCPRRLKSFVDAVERADAIDIIRVGMWLDTGDFDLAYQTIMDKDNGDLKLSKEEN